MSFNQLIFVISTVILLSVGQIFFKIAALSIANGPLINLKIIIAVFVYGLATVMWFFVLRVTPLKNAYPFVGLAFILVPILSSIFLGEKLDVKTLLGALIIAVGIWVSVSEK